MVYFLRRIKDVYYLYQGEKKTEKSLNIKKESGEKLVFGFS